VNPLAIPEIVIRRLPLYLRCLSLLSEQGQTVVSSQEIGQNLGLSSAQIRKDLSFFGEFGKQGTGYDSHYLREELRRILQVDRGWDVALIGAGDLGRALLRHQGFEESGFSIAAVFDNDRKKVGRQIGKLTVQEIAALPELIRDRRIRIAIIAVPAGEAQGVVDVLVDAGIQAILNYAPITLALPEHVRVDYIDPILGLQSMTYYLNPDRP
jgi:redox-sensing transcriptional repressor